MGAGPATAPRSDSPWGHITRLAVPIRGRHRMYVQEYKVVFNVSATGTRNGVTPFSRRVWRWAGSFSRYLCHIVESLPKSAKVNGYGGFAFGDWG